MKRASIWSFMVFLQIGSLNQAQAQATATEQAKAQVMNNVLTPASLTDKPELAIDLLDAQIAQLSDVQQKLGSMSSFDQKLAFVVSLPKVKNFLLQNPKLEEAIQKLPVQYKYSVLAVVALNQGPVIFNNWQNLSDIDTSLKQLADALFASERFYEYMGGLAGYHVKTLQLIRDQLAKKAEVETAKLLLPPVEDIREDSESRRKMVKEGINSLGSMAEIYVVGGAGERLALVDEKTKMPLPVAKLEFAGYTLLENLVRDLEAREYLVYKLTAKQNVTPIVLMTSHEKNNDAQIAAIMEDRSYFGRPKESIFRLLQPMTPVIAIDGNWAVNGPCELVLKPGGHGVIWKLADEYGAFDWLEKKGRKYMIVRQINNPLAGLDTNLFSLAGYGSANKKGFGFESVPRLPNMSEGMNVLKEFTHKAEVACTISNIEYTEFAKAKLNDPQFARIADSPDFPANTNILFANILHVRKAIKELPVPGYLVNMKHPVETLRDGKKVTLLGARLESTMQNIADVMTNQCKAPVSKKDLSTLDTFVLLNERSKTMSVTKKAFDGKSIQETPEGCFYDLMQENLKLLKSVCLFEVDELNSTSDYIVNGPTGIFLYHPALGPVYSVIGQKISKGRLAKNAELCIEASEVSIKNLDVDGSLHIVAELVMGVKNPNTGWCEFSPNVGRCVFENVKVTNKGIDRTNTEKNTQKNSYFKSRIGRSECARIQLLGNSECIAKNVELSGNFELVVQPGKRAIITQAAGGKLNIELQDIDIKHPDSIKWIYTFDKDNNIKLSSST